MSKGPEYTFFPRRHTDGQPGCDKVLNLINHQGNADQPQWDITSHWSEWPLSKYLQTINVGEGVEKREPSCTVGGNVNWYSHYGEQYRGSFKN